MIRIKRGVISKLRHKKILKKSKGYYGSRSRSYRTSFQSVIKSHQYSYRDRKQKKRQFRKLWIIRINAEARKNGINYSKLIFLLKKYSIKINRKILSNIAIFDKNFFKNLIKNKLLYN